MYQLTYRLGAQHWAEYADLAQTRALGVVRGRRFASRVTDAVLAGTLAGLGLYGAHYFFRIEDGLAYAVLASFAVFFGLGAVVSQRHLNTIPPVLPRRDGALLGERTATITDDAVEIVGGAVRHRYEWSAFDRVERLDRMIILWHEPGAGIILPRTAFRSEGEYAGFVEYASECLSQPAKKNTSRSAKSDTGSTTNAPASDAIAGAAE
jgi:hypothetical protein